jgi:hypothetical protein
MKSFRLGRFSDGIEEMPGDEGALRGEIREAGQ